MKTLGRFDKQPIEVQDYDVNFEDYLISQDDTGVSFSVTADAGINIVSSSLLNGATKANSIIKVYVSGGTDGETYKVSATLTTTGGRVKQGDISIRVREL